jgi:hypothetical protein
VIHLCTPGRWCPFASFGRFTALPHFASAAVAQVVLQALRLFASVSPVVTLGCSLG